MKKIIASFIAVITFLLVVFASLYSAGVSPKVKYANDKDVVINVIPYKFNLTTGHAQAIETTTDDAGKTNKAYVIYIVFEGNSKMEGEAVISYTTVDRSAISYANDYVTTSGSVTLNAKEYTKTISIQVNATTFGINYDDKIEEVTREFNFTITNVDYSYGQVAVNGEKNNRTIVCDLPFKHTMKALTSVESTGSFGYFEDYLYNKDVSRKSTWHNVSINDDTNYGPWYGGQDQYHWIEDYVNTGLANVYAGLEPRNLKNSWAANAGDVAYTLYQHNNKSEKLTQLYYDYWRLWHESTPYNEQYDENKNGDLTVRNYGNEVLKTYLSTGGAYRGIKMTDSTKTTNTLNDLKLYLNVDNDLSISTYSVNGYVDMDEILFDNIAPTFVNGYFDGDHSYIDGYARVALRFSEPVQVFKNGAELFARVKIAGKNFSFEYEGGAGTDTLYFRHDISKFTDIAAQEHKEARLMGIFNSADTSTFTYADNIGDFAYNTFQSGSHMFNRFVGKTIGSGDILLNNVKLNLNRPALEKEKDTFSGATSSRTVRVTVSDCYNGTLYYKWSKEKELSYTYHASMDEQELRYFLNQFQEKRAVLNTDGYQTFEIISNNEQGEALHGDYYLHTFVVGGNKKTQYAVYGATNGTDPKPYVFDTLAPEFGEEFTKGAANNPKSRTYSIPLSDDGEGVSEITLTYKKLYGEENTITLWSDGGSSSVFDESTLTFTLTPETFGLGTGEYGYYDITVTAVDKCENKKVCEATIAREFFDTRDLFTVTETKVTGSSPFITTSIGEKAYSLSEQVTLKYSHTDNDVISYIIQNLNYSGVDLILNGELKVGEEELKSYIEVNYSLDKKSISITPLKSGRMSIDFCLNGTKYSDIFNYYFTSTYQDETMNANNILSQEYVKTYVYELSINPFTYLQEFAKDGVKTEMYYSSSSKGLLFSNYNKAKDYVEYMEKQDLNLIKLTENDKLIITALNKGGSQDYVRADGETKQAAAGQYWIRYKAESWTYTNQKWVYYYYGDTAAYSTLNFTYIAKNKNLSNAISNISSYITDLGGYTYLASEEYDNVYGQLTVDNNQIRPTTLTVKESKSGSAYSTDLTFFGDSEIYSSSYRRYEYVNNAVSFIGSESSGVHFVMQYVIDASKDTRFYYCSIDKLEYSLLPNYSSSWVEMENCDGQLFDSYFEKNISGKFYIMEMDDAGVHIFEVYIDHLAPELEVQYVSSSATQETVSSTLDHFWDGNTLGVTSISFNKMKTSEADTYSYVSIYKANYTYDLVGTYTLTDLLKKQIYLQDGSYYVIVSDRFGNSYTFRLNFNTTEMTVDITESEDSSYFTVECNREESQIYSYEVYCGDTLISSTYSARARFYNSGCYFIKIKDIYGNEYDSKVAYGSNGYQFQKALPDVTWRYYTSDGYQTYVDGKANQPMLITSVGSSGDTYYLSTSTSVMFTYSGEYTYTWLSDKPTYQESSTTSGKRVTVESTKGWKLKVYYDKYPDVYVIYICEVDNSAPSILAYYDIYDYEMEDKSYFNQLAANAEVGDVLKGNSYKIVKIEDDSSEAYRNYIRSGDVIQTNTFQVSVEDNNAIASVSVTLDGEPYDASLVTNSNGSITGDFSSYGLYNIVATDIFGNTTSLQFENRETIKVEHYVDEKEVSKTTNYGNTSDVLKLSSTGSIIYMINGNQYIFYVDNEGMYQYNVIAEESKKDPSKMSWCINMEQVLYLVSSTNYFEGTWYPVQGASDPIFVKHTSEGFFVKVEVDGENTYDIHYSVLLDNGMEPTEFSSLLSGEYSDIKLVYSDGKEIKTNHNQDMILVYDDFSFDTTNVNLDLITRIRIAYSKTTSFTYYETIFISGMDSLNNYPTNREGFYSIQITNIYGNVLVYLLNKSDTMTVISVATYIDKTTSTYSNDYNGTVYSNNSVTVTLYSTSGTFKIRSATDVYNVEPDKNGDSLSITIQNIGNYSVEVQDEYGNTKIVPISIQKGSISYSSDLIYGYNTEAILVNQGYTNKQLSINFTKVQDLGITSIQITKGDESFFVYDMNSEKQVIADNESLKECIGTLGTGDYTITFRDVYGNDVSKVIHYNEDGTLKVEVNYRSNTTYKEVDINNITDIWSNNAVTLSSTAIRGVIKVDGSRVDCPLTLNFSSYDGTGSKTYEVTYLDEYGFSYELTIHLLRQEIDINLIDEIETKKVNEVTTTRDNIIVNFQEGTTCTYTLDGGQSNPYEKDQELVLDGTYVFTAVDKAGNVGSLIVAKDTSIQAQFTITSSDYVLMNGAAVNGKVDFQAIGGDSCYISMVMKDDEIYQKGKEVTTRFTEAGKYDVLVVDEMDNEMVFSFIIITHELASFEYHTPYNYEIVEAWITPKGGYLTSYMDYVDSETGFNALEDGSYTISIQSLINGSTYSFNFTIDSTPSPVVLVGATQNESTTSDVTFEGARVGDTFIIYKDGKLIKTVTLATGDDAPVINEGGNYKVIVRNAAGVDVVFTFTRAKIINGAGSALIMIVSGLFSISLFAGLLFRKRSKIDR